MSWKTFPKIELHLHLEGAADPAFIRGSRKRNLLILAGFLMRLAPINTKDLASFCRFMRRPPKRCKAQRIFSA